MLREEIAGRCGAGPPGRAGRQHGPQPSSGAAAGQCVSCSILNTWGAKALQAFKD